MDEFMKDLKAMFEKHDYNCGKIKLDGHHKVIDAVTFQKHLYL
jgi:hypothetical protein